MELVLKDPANPDVPEVIIVNTHPKPFPQKCPNCRKATVMTVVEEYRADVEHDGRSYPLTIPDLPVLTCSACGNRALDRDSSDRVSKALRTVVGLLLPEAIRSYRMNLLLTQKLLAEHLGIAESTLSRWETGAQIQQRAFDKLLRLYFDVPEAHRHLGYIDVSGSKQMVPMVG